MKKLVLCAAAFTMLFGFTFAGGAIAEDKGPAEMMLNADGKKPAKFPHAKHQGGTITCDACHKDLDAKKMATDKNYAHKEKGSCKDCHKAMGTKTSCNTCHPKKKKAIEGC